MLLDDLTVTTATARRLKGEVMILQKRVSFAEDAGRLEEAKRLHNRLMIKLRRLEKVCEPLRYRRGYLLASRLNTACNGGFAERYTRHFGKKKLSLHSFHYWRGPRRRKVSAAFPVVYDGEWDNFPLDDVWKGYIRTIPRWLAKRRGIEGKHIYIAR